MDLQNLQLARFRRPATILAVVVVTYLLFSWFYGHSFIEFTPTTTTTVTYRLYTSKTATPQVFTHKGAFKKLVGRNSFEIVASADDKSYVTIVKTTAFLGVTKIAVETVPEAARTFVGNNPGACLQYATGVLVSNECTEAYAYQKTHIPAGASTPTFVDTPNSSAPGNIEDMHTVNGALYELIQQELYGSAVIHVMNRLEPQLGRASALMDATDLLLPSGKTYDFAAYKDGFIAYSTTFDTFDYFPSFTFTDAPAAISVAPSGKGMSGVGVTIHNKNTIVVLYTNKVLLRAKNETTQATKSEVVVKNDTGKGDYTFKKVYSSALLCGKNVLCAITGTGLLDVYDINSGAAKLQYSLYNVKQAFSGQNDNQLVIADDSGLTAFDTVLRSGHQLYDFGGYRFSAVAQNDTTYLLSVVGAGSKVGLLIDPAVPNSDSIDKRILQLQQDHSIDRVSVYGTNIAIILNRGNPIYGADGQAGYDAAATQTSRAGALTALKNLGIDSSRYSISGL